MNNSNDYEDLKDERAFRRERKKRPRMHQHGRAIKKLSSRGVLKIVKIEKRSKPPSLPLKIRGRRRGL